MTELQPLFATRRLLIKAMPGSGDRLVVSFNGIGGQANTEQQDEFVGTSSFGGTNHVITVTDTRRSWYSAGGLQEQIVQVVQDYKQRHQIREICTLGNSMGGHGALLFASRFGARTAMAFAPQYSLSPKVIDEDRWLDYRPNMVENDLADLADWIDGSFAAYAIFGAQNVKDIPHLDRLRDRTATQVWRVHGAGHSVAKVLKESGKLTDTVSAMMAADGAALARLFGPRSRLLVRAAV